LNQNLNRPPIFQNPQSDGSSFDWQTGSDIGVVCLHGFTATTVEVRRFAAALYRLGFNVSGPLLPGHGISPSELNKVTWMDWYRAADESFERMSSRCRQVFLAGESTGGLLSLLLAANHPSIHGMLLYAPALRIPGLWQTRLLWPFKDFIYKKNIDLASPWQGFNVIPLHGASELYKLQGRVKRILPKVTVPTLIFQGKRDQTIDPLSSVTVLESIASEDKQFVWLADSPHVILLEGPFEDVFQTSLDFIAAHSQAM
jgi:carboxylesterase